MMVNVEENYESDAKTVDKVKEKNLGGVLKKRRMTMNLEVTEVADKLNLNRSVIDEIESHFDIFNLNSVYNRGYLKNYIKLLGLDEEQWEGVLLMDDFNDYIPKMNSFSNKIDKEQLDKKWINVTWIVLTLCIILFFVMSNM